MRGILNRLIGKVPSRLGVTLALALGLSLEGVPLPYELAGVHVALADDDDDDDDDDGASSRSSGGGGPVTYGRHANPFRPFVRNIFRAPPRRARPRAAARAVAPPAFTPNELVASGLDDSTLAGLTAQGFSVLARQPVAALETTVTRLRIPDGTAMQAALQRVRQAAPGASADFNHYYRPEQAAEQATAVQPQSCDGPHCPAIVLVGWPQQRGTCGGSTRIGLIDTAINPDHAALADSDVEIIRIGDGTLPESGRQHGTAVATLLVGAADSTTPGLLPAAKLIAVDVFHRGGGQDDRADAYELARGIDLLVGRDVDAINMSLSGPPNAVVERLVKTAAQKQVLLVAAAGNGGPRAKPVYPAAYPDVIAVTAVDQRKRAYRRAGQGDHIDLAAPGVNIWTAASIRGARPKTGTSFAAPFVTAAAALARASGGTDVTAIQERLTLSAEDLGEPGKDPVFGWGLLNASALCGARAQ